MIACGIDVGARTAKVVLVDSATQRIVGKAIAEERIDQNQVSRRLLDQALEEAGARPDDVGRTIATGYGRERISLADDTVTEISCHARGVAATHPDARTIIEIGGQDSKVIKLNGDGRVRDFVMNDRCAAGTGRFFEIAAQILETDLEGFERLASQSLRPEIVSSMCVLFAESEMVGLLARGAAPADIAAGVHASVADRIAGMAGQRWEPPVVFTGGVALLRTMVEFLQTRLRCDLVVPQWPQFTGAYGAALIACERMGGALDHLAHDSRPARG